MTIRTTKSPLRLPALLASGAMLHAERRGAVAEVEHNCRDCVESNEQIEDAEMLVSLQAQRGLSLATYPRHPALVW